MALVAPAFASIDPAHPKRNDHQKHIISHLVNDTKALNTYAVIFFDTSDYTESSLLELHASLRKSASSADEAEADASAEMPVSGTGGMQKERVGSSHLERPLAHLLLDTTCDINPSQTEVSDTD